jgi:hypothetical protein
MRIKSGVQPTVECHNKIIYQLGRTTDAVTCFGIHRAIF